MNNLSCDVVLFPNPLLAELAVISSKKLSELDSLFQLEDGKCYPHVSIYMLQLKTDDLERVGKLLEVIAHSFSSLQLTTQRYDQQEGYIDADYKKIEELSGLQTEVIQALNPIRDGMRPKDQARMHKAKGLEYDNYKKYGWKSVGDLFRPHMTISRLSTDNSKAMDMLGDYSKFDGTFNSIGLVEMGDNGTAVRKIFEFEFLGSSLLR